MSFSLATDFKVFQFLVPHNYFPENSWDHHPEISERSNNSVKRSENINSIHLWTTSQIKILYFPILKLIRLNHFIYPINSG